MPLIDAVFAAEMAALHPFEPTPTLAVAVSGGADSMALAWLADRWTRGQGGRVIALSVDHGLRPSSADEAALTIARLQSGGIAGEVLRLDGLTVGPDLAARARVARYTALEAACARLGILHLLVAHHAADQAETIAMRMLAGSAADGLAGMAPLVVRNAVRVLRPLLGVAPEDLRDVLRALGRSWIEDPSNHDPRWQRARLREMRRDSPGRGPATLALARSARCRRTQLAARAQDIAHELAARVTMFPEGHAVLAPDPISVPALRMLLRAIGRTRYAPSAAQVAPIARSPRPCTIAGVRLLPAGRLGSPGALLVVREAAAPDASALSDWQARLPYAVRRTLTGRPGGVVASNPAT